MSNLPILLFDDRCGVCHWLVRFVIRHDAGGQFRFAALESPIGEALRARYVANHSVDTVVLIAEHQSFFRSDAVIEIFRRIDGPWRILAWTAILPTRWRDAGYDTFAAWRGRISRQLHLTCELPTLQERARFLDRDELPVVNGVR